MLDLKKITDSWTLFLDRDGVLNYEKPDDYIYNYREFIFYEGVKDALKYFAKRFPLIILTTNQRGIGKGLMTENDLADIHRQMLADINQSGGRIDRIYYAAALHDDDPFRKPHNGMALQAKKDYPQIDFTRSLMIGNNLSDMNFGRNAGMYTVFLKTTHPGLSLPHPSVDLAFDHLEDFAKALQIS